ncbi:Chromatin assembly factor 1 subunit [Conglomerata obtusa]
MKNIENWFPIELTTQNLYFHENASIYSIASSKNTLLTAGGDKEIRSWSLEHIDSDLQPLKIEENFICNEANQSSVKINYNKTFSHHSKTVNCVRFSDCGQFFASCGDGGEVVVCKGEEKVVVKEKDGDDCYELVWMENHIVVGTATGKLLVYAMEHIELQNKIIKDDLNDNNENVLSYEHNKTNDCVQVENNKDLFENQKHFANEMENHDKDTNIQDIALSSTTQQNKILNNEKGENEIKFCAINYNDEILECSIIENEEFEKTHRVNKLNGKDEYALFEQNSKEDPEAYNDNNKAVINEDNTLFDDNKKQEFEFIIDNNKENKNNIVENKKEETLKTKKFRNNKTNAKSNLKSFKFKLIQNIRAHSDIIQGLAYNNKYKVIATASKDRSTKTFYFEKKLVYIDKIEFYNKERCFADDVSKILFRRLSFSSCNKFLYLPASVDTENRNFVYILHYPFRSIDFYGRIGPLEQPAIKIISYNEFILILCKKMIYFCKNQKVLFSIKHVAFFPMTDCCIVNNVFCFSALDGFLYTLKLEKLIKDKKIK